MTVAMSADRLQPRLLATIALAGVAAAVLEMVAVLPIQYFALHNSPDRIFQFIALGWQGMAALKGGVSSIMLGVAIHLLVSLGAAAVFALASLEAPVLRRRWVTSGLMFGLVVYGVMTWFVIPLSAIPKGDATPPPHLIATSVAIHLFFFALPISAIVRAGLGEDRP